MRVTLDDVKEPPALPPGDGKIHFRDDVTATITARPHAAADDEQDTARSSWVGSPLPNIAR